MSLLNIIIIEDPSETDMPDRRPIRDLDMLHQRLTCPIGDPSETKMLHRRHIGDQHA